MFAILFTPKKPLTKPQQSKLKKILTEHGFSPQGDGIFMGKETVNAVSCVLAITDLSERLSWVATSFRSIRMVRIEEITDLSPALKFSPHEGKVKLRLVPSPVSN